MVDFGSDILDTEVPEVEPLDVDISEEPQHELTMALTNGAANSSSPVVFDFSLQSRVEVILNAIINDLVYGEHPKSRVEQILLYILGEENELPKPHSRVEELLIDLALELESTDISPKSRVEQILLVLLNQPYEFPITHSRVEELLIQLQMHVSEVTGPLPLTINTNGTALIDYRIYGNTEQTGTPTPESPIMPSGCGERTENLFTPSADKGYYQNDQFIADDDYLCTPYIPLDDPKYWVKMDFDTTNAPIGGKYGVEWFDDYNVPVYGECIDIRFHAGWIYDGRYEVDPEVVVVHTPKYVRAFIHKDCTKVNLSIGSDREHNPYVPHGYKLPILSNSTVTNIYLGEVQSTRRIKKLVLTGEENWHTKIETNVRVFFIPNSQIPNNEILCTHYTVRDWPGVKGYDNSINVSYTYAPHSINVRMDTYNTVSDFKSYLAAQYANGTPVTIWYVLAEPETAVVNEPLMKIGGYTDTVSMEQAGVSIPTIKGTTVIDYDGTPKPSQMYVKYNES